MPIYDGARPSKFLPGSAAGEAGSQWPENAVASTWGRLEPLLTPDQLKSRFLFGIPLVSRLADPDTGKRQRMTDDMLKDYIDQAVDMGEAETGLEFMPTKFSQKLPMDKPLYDNFGFFTLEHRPIYSVDLLTVRPADNSDVFSVPLTWVETAYLQHGQINIIPLALSLPAAGGTGVFLNILANKPWVPAFWGIEYTAGFMDGEMPKVVNDYIGTIAAMEVLSQLAATNARSNSTSLSIDGGSQSVSGPGPQVYVQRLQELEAKRKMLCKKIKKKCGGSFVVGNV